MSTADDTQETRSPDEIRADIEQTREQVGDTVEALTAKTDVKAQAHDRLDEIKGNLRENPAPLVIGGAVLVVLLVGRRMARS